MARVIIKPSSIIIADEPTGSLDPINRDIIMDMLKYLNNSGKTVIIATHDPIVAKSANKVISFD